MQWHKYNSKKNMLSIDNDHNFKGKRLYAIVQYYSKNLLIKYEFTIL